MCMSVFFKVLGCVAYLVLNATQGALAKKVSFPKKRPKFWHVCNVICLDTFRVCVCVCVCVHARAGVSVRAYACG